MNPQAFTWGADPSSPTVTPCVVSSINALGGTILNTRFASGDMDGDGLADIIQLYKIKSNLSGQDLVYDCVKVNTTGLKGTSNVLQDGVIGQSATQGGFSYTVTDAVLMAEFNGDQKKTALVPILSNISTQYCFRLKDIKSSVCIDHPLQVTNEIPAYAIGDFNNDGSDEIIIIEKSRNSNSHAIGVMLYVKKQNRAHEISEDDELIVDPIDIALSSNVKQIHVSDYNSDGLLDMLLVTDQYAVVYKNIGGAKQSDGIVHVSFESSYSTSEIYSSCSAIRPGDFNGDGLTDFLVNGHSNAVWKLILNTGCGFSCIPVGNMTAVEESFTSENNNKDECMIVDFNRDGKSDVVLVDAVYKNDDDDYQHTDIKWYQSNGDYFTIVNTYTIKDENYFFRNNYTINDFNGDGMAELFTYDSNLFTGTDGTDAGRLYYYNMNHDANKLVSIKDGWGSVTDIKYQFLTWPKDRFDGNDFYTVGTEATYPLCDLSVPLSCVSRVVLPDGLGGSSTNEYSYTGLLGHIQKGMLGFTSEQVINSTANSRMLSATQYNGEYGLPTYTVTENQTLSLGDVMEKTECWLSNTKNGRVYTSQPFVTVHTNLLTGVTTTTDQYSYDAWGNPTYQRTMNQDFSEVKQCYYSQVGPWNWCPNKVDSIITVRGIENLAGYDEITRKESREYDTKGNLIAVVTDPSDVNALRTAYKDINDFGLPETIEVTANGVTRRSTIEYTPSGRFVLSKTNSLGETKTFDWDEARGLLDSESTRLGTTSYTYDGLGRLAHTLYSDGIKKVDVLRWATPGNSYGARYFNYSETSGAAPVKNWYDALGREVVSETKGLNDTTVRKFTQYYPNGMVWRISEPTFNTSATEWSLTHTYDEYGRLSAITTPKGESSYTYWYRTTTVTSPEGVSVVEYNTLGNLLYSNVNGQSVDYDYYASGLVKAVYPSGTASYEDVEPIRFEYDLQGNRTKLIDPNAGTINSVFNGFGELTSSSRLMHNGVLVTTTNNYAPGTGLLQSIVRNGETTVYSYDNLHRLSSIEIAGKNRQAFSYDAYDRIVRTEESIGAKTFTTETEYDALGRIKRHIYPSGYHTTNWYDVNGLMTEVTDASNRSIWKPIEYNAKGQLKREQRGGRETSYSYDSLGFMTGITCQGIINQTYGYTSAGNLEYRQDGAFKEQFTYDAQQRLTNWNIYNYNIDSAQFVQLNGQTYDPLTGNIATRSALGNASMIYSLNGPHSLDTIKGMPSVFPTDNLNVTYTDFSKIASLSEGNKLYTLTYGVDDQRRKSTYQVNGLTKQTRYYLDDYEEEIDAAGNIRKIHYLSGGAVLIRNNGVDSLLYGYADYLGSLTTLTDVNGNVLERYAYDPWGQRRDSSDWTQQDKASIRLLNRGYTMHEHLDAFQIINMNGRVYDPLTAQFFSPDPFVQAPGSWLNYNRYSYCYNNPFSYSDPSGEWIHIVIGAAIGGVINVAVHWKQIDGNWGKGLAAFGIGALGGAAAAASGGAALGAFGTAAGAGGFVGGAIVGGVGYSFGTVCTSAGNNMFFGDPMPTGKQFLTGLGVSMLTGGVINGSVSAANDGNFWTGPKTPQPTVPTPAQTTTTQETIQNSETQPQTQNSQVNNPIPEKVVRVVPDNSTHPQLGYTDDVFVTAAEDIKGLNAYQISDRLGIDLPPSGYVYRAYEFPTPNGISSPISFNNPYFVGRGLTVGGLREFNIPNMNINNIQGLTIFRIYF